MQRAFGSHDVLKQRDFGTENLAVEEKQRSQCLVLCGSADVVTGRHAGQKRIDPSLWRLARLWDGPVLDEELNPVGIGAFGPGAIMTGLDSLGVSLKQARGGLGALCEERVLTYARCDRDPGIGSAGSMPFLGRQARSPNGVEEDPKRWLIVRILPDLDVVVEIALPDAPDRIGCLPFGGTTDRGWPHACLLTRG